MKTYISVYFFTFCHIFWNLRRMLNAQQRLLNSHKHNKDSYSVTELVLRRYRGVLLVLFVVVGLFLTFAAGCLLKRAFQIPICCAFHSKLSSNEEVELPPFF